MFSQDSKVGGSEQGQDNKVGGFKRNNKMSDSVRISGLVVQSGQQGGWFSYITKSTDLYFVSRGQCLSDHAMWSGCQGL